MKTLVIGQCTLHWGRMEFGNIGNFYIMQQLFRILEKRRKAINVYLLEEIYDAWETKAILGQFDMVVSGRVHAAVGAMSQSIPTVVLDYGHEPKAHKLRGFTESAGQLKYLAQPDKLNDINKKITQVWENRRKIKDDLNFNIPIVKDKAKENFTLLRNIFNN
jgi:colanic acid/amylovoran biosynthesis protein